MSFVCEISGESLLTVADGAVVVTPSGHVCRRSLLLQKLAENGGMDPFQTDRPLQEDELIELSQYAGKTVVVPPRNSSNMSSTLHQLQQEYEAVILELFDTRKVLEETRKELSLALYQNDAAVRVVARMAAERDQAVAALQQWSNNSGESSTTTTVVQTNQTSASGVPEDGGVDQPATKKAKLDTVDSSSSSSSGAIPETDLNTMMAAWEELHQARKARQKQAAKDAVTAEQLEQFAVLKQKGAKLPAIASCDHDDASASTEAAVRSTALGSSTNNQVVQVSRHRKEILVYQKDEGGKAWALTTVGALSCACVGGSIDIQGRTVVAGLANGSVDVVNVETGDVVGTCLVAADNKAAVVDVRLHPDGQHFVAATADGKVVLGRIIDKEVTVAAKFEQADVVTKYSAGALHPDGLIYVAGDVATGNLLLWDFKSQSLAGTLAPPVHGAVKTVEFSNNGYHIVAAYESGDVLVWDLRKQAVLATLNNKDDKLETVVSVKFDDSGKYLAYSGSRGGDGLVICITTVKEWGSTATFQVPKLQASPGLVWGATWIAASATKSSRNKTEPQVAFFGL